MTNRGWFYLVDTWFSSCRWTIYCADKLVITPKPVRWEIYLHYEHEVHIGLAFCKWCFLHRWPKNSIPRVYLFPVGYLPNRWKYHQFISPARPTVKAVFLPFSVDVYRATVNIFQSTVFLLNFEKGCDLLEVYSIQIPSERYRSVTVSVSEQFHFSIKCQSILGFIDFLVVWLYNVSKK